MNRQEINTEVSLRLAGGGTRIGYIDALKGFAALCVVFGHVAQGYIGAGMYPENLSLLKAIYNCTYSFHMPLFYIISGYLYHHSYFREDRPQRKRIRAQVFNLVGIYILFSVAFGLFKIICSQYTNNETTFHDILLIGVKAIFPYWYLYVLIIYYLIFSIPLFSNKKAELLMLAVVIGGCICSYFVPEETWFQLRYVMYYMLYFYIGFFLSSGRNRVLNTKVVLPMFFAAITLLVLIWLTDAGNISYSVPGDKPIIAIGFSAILWYHFENVLFLGDCRMFQICGKYAMEIYVLHCVFTAGNRVLLPRLGITNIYLNIICNVLISTAVPILSAVASKRLGIYNLIFKPSYYFTDKTGK